MINELLPYEIGISVSYPLPGTGFYEKVKPDLKEKTNWTDSDELALMFHNTYQPSFYKHLHRYVHKIFRKQIAFNQISRIAKKPMAANWEMIRKAISYIYLVPAVFIAKMKLNQLQKSQ